MLPQPDLLAGAAEYQHSQPQPFAEQPEQLASDGHVQPQQTDKPVDHPVQPVREQIRPEQSSAVDPEPQSRNDP